MPAKYRLSRADFTRMRYFKRLNGAIFSFSYGTLDGRTSPGGACVVSSKIAKRAADRNRIKRKVRAALSALLKVMKETPKPLVVVCYAKKGALSPHADIAGEIAQLSTKLDILR